jgi:phosphoribosyl-ATP pyrophosphohydrolase
MTNYEKVIEFMKTFGQECPDKPMFPSKDVVALRYELIREELEELKDAIKDKDIVEVADALVDIVYVTLGAAASFGIDFDSCFEEVHRSNMTKLGADGNPVYREDGKVKKSNLYVPPDLAKVLKIT